MKMNYRVWLSLIGICILLAACKKDNTSNSNQEDRLPPASQTGANTFGCLVNGKVYVPKGADGSTKPNLRKNYDNFQGDTYLSIDTYRYVDQVFDGQLNFTTHNLTSTGIYTTNQLSNRFDYGGKFFNNCGISVLDTTTFRKGIITVTRLDLTAGIISGLFNCKIKPTNCDTIFITEGRFDFKL